MHLCLESPVSCSPSRNPFVAPPAGWWWWCDDQCGVILYPFTVTPCTLVVMWWLVWCWESLPRCVIYLQIVVSKVENIIKELTWMSVVGTKEGENHMLNRKSTWSCDLLRVGSNDLKKKIFKSFEPRSSHDYVDFLFDMLVPSHLPASTTSK